MVVRRVRSWIRASEEGRVLAYVRVLQSSQGSRDFLLPMPRAAPWQGHWKNSGMPPKSSGDRPWGDSLQNTLERDLKQPDVVVCSLDQFVCGADFFDQLLEHGIGLKC